MPFTLAAPALPVAVGPLQLLLVLLWLLLQLGLRFIRALATLLLCSGWSWSRLPTRWRELGDWGQPLLGTLFVECLVALSPVLGPGFFYWLQRVDWGPGLSGCS